MTDNEKITGVPIDDEALDKVAGGVMYVVPSERENHAANANPNGTTNISSRDPVPVEISTVPISTEINDLIEDLNNLKYERRDYEGF